MYKKELDSGTLLFVEVPMDAQDFNVQINPVEGGEHICFLRGMPDYACSYTSNIPNGNWQPLGDSLSLTEEQLKDVMPSYLFQLAGIKNAKPVTLYLDFVRNAFVLSTATEAFQSLKSSLGLIDENKYGKKPVFKGACLHDGFESEVDKIERELFKVDREQWQSEQSKVKKLIVLFNPKK